MATHIRIPFNVATTCDEIPRIIHSAMDPATRTLLQHAVCGVCKNVVAGSMTLACGCTVCPSCRGKCLTLMAGTMMVCNLCDTAVDCDEEEEEDLSVQIARNLVSVAVESAVVRCTFCGATDTGVASLMDHLSECPRAPCICIKPGCGRIVEAGATCQCAGDVEAYAMGFLDDLALQRHKVFTEANATSFCLGYVGASPQESALRRQDAMQEVLRRSETMPRQKVEIEGQLESLRSIIKAIKIDQACPFTPFNAIALVRAAPVAWLPAPSDWSLCSSYGTAAYREAMREAITGLCSAQCQALNPVLVRPYQCGHTVCGGCAPRIDVCPQCRAGRSDSVVQSSSRLASALLLQCPCHREKGGGVKLAHAEAHMCEDMYMCPFPGCMGKIVSNNRKVVDRHINRHHTNNAVWTAYCKRYFEGRLSDWKSDWADYIDHGAFRGLMDLTLSIEVEEVQSIELEC